MEINEVARTQIEAIKEKCKIIKPLVVIWCITYNHEKFLTDTLEGFIMQKTDFPFVAIVHEDASTDNTAKVLKEYAERYPNLIFPILEKQNQFTQKDSLDRIMLEVCKASGAKYTALCEGDDYWIDELKLETQVGFLEAHPDYSFCFHSVNVVKEEGCKANIDIFKHLEERSYNVDEIIKTWTIPTCSVVCRTDKIALRPFNENFQYSDNVWWSTLLRYGEGFCITKKMAVYRRQTGSWTTKPSFETNKKYIIHFEALFKEFPEINNNTQVYKLANFYSLAFLTGVRKLDVSAFQYLFSGMIKYRFKYLKALFMSVIDFFKRKLIKT